MYKESMKIIISMKATLYTSIFYALMRYLTLSCIKWNCNSSSHITNVAYKIS